MDARVSVRSGEFQTCPGTAGVGILAHVVDIELEHSDSGLIDAKPLNRLNSDWLKRQAMDKTFTNASKGQAVF